ncbi:MAG: RHS repeat-associated core domain-containing protein [Myxococcota bacterium]
MLTPQTNPKLEHHVRVCLLAVLLVAPVACRDDAGTSYEATTASLDGAPPLPPDPTTPEGQILPTQEVGTLPGALTVSPSGSPQYALPIRVPEGRGLEPRLSVSYSGAGANGLFGVGWTLNGLSRITPCRRTTAQDGASGRVEFQVGDAYCLDGARLVAISGIPGDDGTEYRTENDRQVQVFSHGTVAGMEFGVPARFEVRHPAGEIWHYERRFQGQQVDHRDIRGLSPTTREIVWSWALSRIDDRSGNSMHFDYQEVAATPSASLAYDDRYALEFYPDQIRYTSHESGLEALRTVRFAYDDRSDPVDMYSAGVHIRIGRRIRRIDMFAPRGESREPSLAWYYKFGYAQSEQSGRSLLTSVALCDAGDRCLPATEFSWEGGSTAYDEIEQELEGVFDFRQIPRWASGDFNGDGQSDLLYWEGRRAHCLLDPSSELSWDGAGEPCASVGTIGVTGEWRIAYSNGTIFSTTVATGLRADFETRPSPYVPIDHGSSPEEYNAPTVLDFDGDGFSDLYTARAGEIRSRGTGTVLQTLPGPRLHSLVNSEPDVRFIGDFNGDGRMDLFTNLDRPMASTDWDVLGEYVSGWSGPGEWDEYHWAYRLGGGAGFGPETPSTTVPYMLRQTSVVPNVQREVDSRRLGLTMDVDGDGRMELLLPKPEGELGLVPLYESFEVDASGAERSGVPINLAYRWFEVAGMTRFGPFSPVYLDINGDGLRDVVAVNGVEHAGSDYLAARINTGNGFGPWYLASGPGYQPPEEQRSAVQRTLETYSGFFPLNPMSDTGVRVLDFNADGRDDLLVPTASGPLLYLSNGRGYDAAPAGLILEPAISETAHHEEYGVYSSFVGFGHRFMDVDGNGLPDLVQFDYGRRVLRVAKRQGAPPDRLRRVKNGFGRFDEVYYTTLTNRDVYTPGSGCVHPMRCMRGGGEVVQTLTQSAPEGIRIRNYRYEDGRVDVEGRGFVGFHRHVMEDTSADRTLTLSFDTDRREHGAYPVASRWDLRRVETKLPDGRHHLELTSRAFDVPWRWDDGVFRVDERRRVTRVFEFDGPIPEELELDSAQRVSEVDRTFDDYGNPRTVESQTSGYIESEESGAPVFHHGQRTLVTTTYDIRPDPWLVRLPLDRVVTSFAAPPDTRSVTRSTRYVHDAAGRLEEEIAEPGSPRLELRTTYGFGAHGEVETITSETSPSDPLTAHSVRTQVVEYDPEYLFPALLTNAMGHATEVTIHPEFGEPQLVRDPNGVETYFAYDGLGRPRGMQHASGRQSWRDYQPGYAGPMRIWNRQVSGEESVTELNVIGRPMRHERESFDGSVAVIERVYDLLGRPTKESNAFIDPTDRVFTTTEYDALNRVTKVIDTLGHDLRNEYRLDQQTTVDRNGNTSYVRFDVDGRMTDSVEVATDAATADHVRTTYEYAPFGLLEAVTDAEGKRVLIGYDARGRRTSLNDPDAGNHHWTLNAYGEMDTLYDPESDIAGVPVRYVRDALGRVERITSLDGTDEYFWDDPMPGGSGVRWLGARHGARSADGTETETLFDTFGRLRGSRTRVDGGGYAVDYDYDASSRLRRVHYPVVAGQPRFVTRLGYAGNGALATVDQEGGANLWTAITRDGAGRIESERAGNGVVTDREYDPGTGQLTRVRAYDGTIPRFGFDYAYDKNGNLTSRQEVVVNRFDTYTYDSRDRLAWWTRRLSGGTEFETEYVYDRVGGLAERHHRGGDVQTEEYIGRAATGNAPRSYQRLEHGEIRTEFEMDYDGNGRRVQGPWDEVRYTRHDLPSRVEREGRVSLFAYDADGRRVRELSEGVRTISVGKLYELRDTEGTAAHRFFVASDVGTVAKVVYDEGSGAKTRHFLHQAKLGSGVATTDDAGNLSERRWFTPFGHLTDDAGIPHDEPSGTDALHVGFTGHDHDVHLGLIDMNGRVYDPLSATFLTADPIVSAPYNAQGFNRYAYVLNNPLRYVDPTGLSIGWDGEIGMYYADGDDARRLTGQDVDQAFFTPEMFASVGQDQSDGSAQSSDADDPPGGDDTPDAPSFEESREFLSDPILHEVQGPPLPDVLPSQQPEQGTEARLRWPEEVSREPTVRDRGPMCSACDPPSLFVYPAPLATPRVELQYPDELRRFESGDGSLNEVVYVSPGITVDAHVVQGVGGHGGVQAHFGLPGNQPWLYGFVGPALGRSRGAGASFTLAFGSGSMEGTSVNAMGGFGPFSLSRSESIGSGGWTVYGVGLYLSPPGSSGAVSVTESVGLQ